MEEAKAKQKKIIDYYSTKESQWGYAFLLKGVRHFGYYPEGQENISMAEAQRLMVEKLYAKLNLRPDSLLLDAGCGEGEVATYLANKYQLQVKGVDLLDFSIEKATQKRTRLGLEKQVEFSVGSYENLKFAEEMFDGSYTMETLIHAIDYKQALRELYRVLKPRGRLVLFEYSSCPSHKVPLGLRETAETVVRESGMYGLLSFLHGEFPSILQKAGFKNVAVENITPRVMPMLKRFRQLTFVPYWFTQAFKLQRKFVNITAGAEGYNVAKNDLWRYNIITAIKPN